MSGRRLLVVVPYRDRAAHLKQFVPHLRAYFARDKADRSIDYRVLVVEQEAGLPFNAGALKNAGFLLAGADAEYTCFHDIDYLPVWSDYSWADAPTPLVWHGAQVRPVAPGESTLFLRHDLEKFFGACVLVPNALVQRVNGYANAYWGWGYEDEDFRARFLALGIQPGRRRGTYMPLDHRNAGFDAAGKPRAIAAVNQRLFERRQAEGMAMATDGLSTLRFEVLDRRPIPDAKPERPATWEIARVRLRHAPTPEQAEALAADA
ncbi:MAG TPA: galactosyltransferase-related protein [Casimicrobiaceae bacterium]|nr:galactosyltransferase-related protein [Casimicrobiaceae bacterium]